MCGIAGYKCGPKHTSKAFAVFTRLMEEAQVRGRHASGLSWVSRGKVTTYKLAKPVEELVQSKLWRDLATDAPTEAIGHARYSTSGDWHDNKNNQPVATAVLALVHNGLVSMATQEEFERAYGVRTVSGNDSEVLLRRVEKARGDLAKAFEAVYAVDPPIFACGLLNVRGDVTVVRDHIRPLWAFQIKKLSMTGFASTKDIIDRALAVLGYAYEVWETEPYTAYQLSEKSVEKRQKLAFAVPSELRFERPPIEQPMLQAAATPERAELDSPRYKQPDHRRNLRKSFKQYCVAAISTWEIDPNYPLINYLFRRFELSKSQEYWACFLYATFYHPGSVFYVMQEFPEFEKVDLGRLEKWHAANWRQLQYNTDRKYEKGHFVEMFVSYRDAVGGQHPTAQEEFFAELLTGTAVENFHAVTKALRGLWHFGRYSVYIYTECLARCMGMPMEADTIFLKESDSPRAGLCKVLGKDEWAKGSLAKDQWLFLEEEAIKLMREIQEEYPTLGMDHWYMESCLCAYKGFFRPTKGRYLPYYLDRMGHEIGQMRDGAAELTSGVEWNVLSQFRREVIIPEYLGELAEPPRTKVTKSMEHVLRDTGRMVGLWPIKQRGLLK